MTLRPYVLILLSLSLIWAACGENQHEARRRLKEAETATSNSEQSNTRSQDFVEAKGYRIYVENSGSMLGYFKGNTEFKTLLLDLGSRLKEKNASFFYITDKAYPIPQGYEGFVRRMTLEEASKIGNQASSDIPAIVSTAIAETVPQGLAALVASDFIFSISGKDPLDDLSKQKFILKTEVEKLKAKGYGLLIMQCRSEFDGRYFNFQNKAVNFKGRRPYYVWLIAPIASLNRFVETYQLQTLKGFERFLVLYDSQNLGQAYSSLLVQSQRVGRFNRPRGLSKGQAINSLEGFKLDERRNLAQFALALDLSKVPLSEKELLELERYEIQTQGGLSLELNNIVPLSEFGLHQNDRDWLGSASHVAIFQAKGQLGRDGQTIELRLKKALPDWLRRLSTDNDLDIQATADRTFGLRFLIEGAAEAFDMPGRPAFWASFNFEVKP